VTEKKNMAQINAYYPAKLLLFGEYTVLNGSQALAVPLHQWQGKWVQGSNRKEFRNQDLSNYVTWLKKNDLINTEMERAIASDFENGWDYSSSIPQGYGVGSSGAFVAAIYDRYFSASDDINEIHSTMARMEGYFHGASSGLDPLISYTNKAVYKDEENRYHSIHDPGWPEGYRIYLLDSGTGRETGPLVQTYKAKLKVDNFAEVIERQFIPMVEHALHFYLAGENKLLEETLSVISQFQREHFTEMIPELVRKQWDELVAMPGVYVKLCGAGGGGYFLVITFGDIPDTLLPKLILLN
jgi:mevalonate kinase